ncbi:hypothetical protein H4219_004616 [Mycoemilia scoparia]|uniref:Uncharacterized protein n=1 Tax=Mycoemilia scoparia TaxID=417184 RepID=A0A9W8DR23_9FUNG|nr:hypothetical protein H4219_004616 [Mycoemilia scoparia]
MELLISTICKELGITKDQFGQIEKLVQDLHSEIVKNRSRLVKEPILGQFDFVDPTQQQQQFKDGLDFNNDGGNSHQVNDRNDTESTSTNITTTSNNRSSSSSRNNSNRSSGGGESGIVFGSDIGSGSMSPPHTNVESSQNHQPPTASNRSMKAKTNSYIRLRRSFEKMIGSDSNSRHTSSSGSSNPGMGWRSRGDATDGHNGMGKYITPLPIAQIDSLTSLSPTTNGSLSARFGQGENDNNNCSRMPRSALASTWSTVNTPTSTDSASHVVEHQKEINGGGLHETGPEITRTLSSSSVHPMSEETTANTCRRASTERERLNSLRHKHESSSDSGKLYWILQQQLEQEAKKHAEEVKSSASSGLLKRSASKRATQLEALRRLYDKCWHLLTLLFVDIVAVKLVGDYHYRDQHGARKERNADVEGIIKIPGNFDDDGDAGGSFDGLKANKGTSNDSGESSSEYGNMELVKLAVLAWFPKLKYLDIQMIPTTSLIGWSLMPYMDIEVLLYLNPYQQDVVESVLFYQKQDMEIFNLPLSDAVKANLGLQASIPVAAMGSINSPLGSGGGGGYAVWNCLEFLDLSGQSLPNFNSLIRQLATLLPFLRRLSLSSCGLTRIPDALSILKLEWLDLSHNSLTECHGLDARMVNLTHLDLRENEISRLHPLCRLQSLLWLDVSNNMLNTWQNVAVLRVLPNLCYLWASENPFVLNFGSDYMANLYRVFWSQDKEGFYLNGEQPSVEMQEQIQMSVVPPLPELSPRFQPVAIRNLAETIMSHSDSDFDTDSLGVGTNTDVNSSSARNSLSVYDPRRRSRASSSGFSFVAGRGGRGNSNSFSIANVAGAATDAYMEKEERDLVSFTSPVPTTTSFIISLGDVSDRLPNGEYGGPSVVHLSGESLISPRTSIQDSQRNLDHSVWTEALSPSILVSNYGDETQLQGRRSISSQGKRYSIRDPEAEVNGFDHSNYSQIGSLYQRLARRQNNQPTSLPTSHCNNNNVSKPKISNRITISGRAIHNINSRQEKNATVNPSYGSSNSLVRRRTVSTAAYKDESVNVLRKFRKTTSRATTSFGCDDDGGGAVSRAERRALAERDQYYYNRFPQEDEYISSSSTTTSSSSDEEKDERHNREIELGARTAPPNMPLPPAPYQPSHDHDGGEELRQNGGERNIPESYKQTMQHMYDYLNGMNPADSVEDIVIPNNNMGRDSSKQYQQDQSEGDVGEESQDSSLYYTPAVAYIPNRNSRASSPGEDDVFENQLASSSSKTFVLGDDDRELASQDICFSPFTSQSLHNSRNGGGNNTSSGLVYEIDVHNGRHRSPPIHQRRELQSQQQQQQQQQQMLLPDSGAERSYNYPYISPNNAGLLSNFAKSTESSLNRAYGTISTPNAITDSDDSSSGGGFLNLGRGGSKNPQYIRAPNSLGLLPNKQQKTPSPPLLVSVGPKRSRDSNYMMKLRGSVNDQYIIDHILSQTESNSSNNGSSNGSSKGERSSTTPNIVKNTESWMLDYISGQPEEMSKILAISMGAGIAVVDNNRAKRIGSNQRTLSIQSNNNTTTNTTANSVRSSNILGYTRGKLTTPLEKPRIIYSQVQNSPLRNQVFTDHDENDSTDHDDGDDSGIKIKEDGLLPRFVEAGGGRNPVDNSNSKTRSRPRKGVPPKKDRRKGRIYQYETPDISEKQQRGEINYRDISMNDKTLLRQRQQMTLPRRPISEYHDFDDMMQNTQEGQQQQQHQNGDDGDNQEPQCIGRQSTTFVNEVAGLGSTGEYKPLDQINHQQQPGCFLKTRIRKSSSYQRLRELVRTIYCCRSSKDVTTAEAEGSIDGGGGDSTGSTACSITMHPSKSEERLDSAQDITPPWSQQPQLLTPPFVPRQLRSSEPNNYLHSRKDTTQMRPMLESYSSSIHKPMSIDWIEYNEWENLGPGIVQIYSPDYYNNSENDNNNFDNQNSNDGGGRAVIQKRKDRPRKSPETAIKGSFSPNFDLMNGFGGGSGNPSNNVSSGDAGSMVYDKPIRLNSRKSQRPGLQGIVSDSSSFSSDSTSLPNPQYHEKVSMHPNNQFIK